MIEILDKMFEGLNPDSVFEVGCSEGAMLEDIGKKYGNIRLGGIDKNGEDVKKAKVKLEKWDKELYTGDARGIPWPIKEHTYDVVFCVGTLMYIKNPLVVIQEMIHLTKNKVMFAEPIYTQSGMIVDSVTGIPFDSYGERFNHDYLAFLTSAGIRAKTEFFGDKIIFKLI